MILDKSRIYHYVLDNNSQFCLDEYGNFIYIGTEDAGSSVQVRRVKGEFFPCSRCKYRNSEKVPSTHIHGLQQRSKNYSQHQKAGKELGLGYQHYGSSEILGDCPDFEKLT